MQTVKLDRRIPDGKIPLQRFPRKDSKAAVVSTPESSERSLGCSHQCLYCPKAFPTAEILAYHIRVHTRKKPLECPTCRRQFTHKTFVAQHISMVHTNSSKKESVHGCRFCPMKFARKSHLQLHVRCHVIKRPFECSTCSKKYVRKECLARHIKRKHESERPSSLKKLGEAAGAEAKTAAGLTVLGSPAKLGSVEAPAVTEVLDLSKPTAAARTCTNGEPACNRPRLETDSTSGDPSRPKTFFNFSFPECLTITPLLGAVVAAVEDETGKLALGKLGEETKDGVVLTRKLGSLERSANTPGCKTWSLFDGKTTQRNSDTHLPAALPASSTKQTKLFGPSMTDALFKSSNKTVPEFGSSQIEPSSKTPAAAGKRLVIHNVLLYAGGCCVLEDEPPPVVKTSLRDIPHLCDFHVKERCADNGLVKLKCRICGWEI